VKGLHGKERKEILGEHKYQPALFSFSSLFLSIRLKLFRSLTIGYTWLLYFVYIIIIITFLFEQCEDFTAHLGYF